MVKAKREVREKLKLIDVVIELVDARIPLSSRNPLIDEIVGDKPRILILNKIDMADQKETRAWNHYFTGKGFVVIEVNSQSGEGLNKIAPACRDLMKEKHDKLKAKGVNPRAVRALILGIPNVGKSTLINRLAKKNIAQTGDKPGVTKKQQWIKVGKELELLDTPGILWPKFEDQQVGMRLAATGAIKETLFDFQDVVVFILKYLKEHYAQLLQDRYNLSEIPEDVIELFDEIGRKRGCLLSGGYIDYDKAAEIILRDVRSLKIGKITFEKANEIE
jgi:ribosome biogenesis GTPase A